MAKTVAIGIQDFGELIQKECLYIDKTSFIKEWWESKDSVTLITRPRRFGKTLNMSMLEQFFSITYAEQGDLFEGLFIWKDEKYRRLQGTYPVIGLTFADVKEQSYENARERIGQILAEMYSKYCFLRESDALTDLDRTYFDKILSAGAGDVDLSSALRRLSDFLCRHYGKKAIILLDEYDTPMQEAYMNGYWDELAAFTRNIFNSTFKTNPFLERAVMTGITRISKESMFSDLNHLKVVTTTSNKYATSFGFTEDEVFAAMDEMGLEQRMKAKVKEWYDGFTFGSVNGIYNPWSVLNFLDERKFSAYWANTSSNSLAGKLIRQGSRRIKEQFEVLLQGNTIKSHLDEQIVFNQLGQREDMIWSLLLASGYLTVVHVDFEEEIYELKLTNYEVRRMFEDLISGWFYGGDCSYNDFIRALLLGDLDAMNEYMNRVTASVFSSFDAGVRPSCTEPERFYHGFVLGMMIELQDRYVLTSNRESGFGRYDVVLQPRGLQDGDAIIIEFKVFNAKREKSLEDTLASALAQIEEKQYDKGLIAQGIAPERIRRYGFAFEGKHVLIG